MQWRVITRGIPWRCWCLHCPTESLFIWKEGWNLEVPKFAAVLTSWRNHSQPHINGWYNHRWNPVWRKATHIRKTLNMHITLWCRVAISQKWDDDVNVGRSLGTSWQSAVGWIASRMLPIIWKGGGQSSRHQSVH